MNNLELSGGLSTAAGIALLAGAALAAFLAGALAAARRRKLGTRLAVGGLYALAASTATLALLTPVAARRSEKPVLPRVAVLADRSASMNRSDLPDGGARYTLAADLLANDSPFLRRLEGSARTSLLAFDSGVRPLEAGELGGPPRGRATDISAALEAAFDAPGVGRLGAVLMITDGRATAGRPPETNLAGFIRRGVPVWVLGTGNPAGTSGPRLAVVDFDLPERAVLGSEVDADASVRAEGLAGGEVTVRLLVDGREAGRQQLKTAANRERLPVRFSFPARPLGVRRVEIVAEAGGVPAARSARYLIVEGRPLRALYVEGRLGWGYRTLAAALASAPGREVELEPAFVAAAGGEPRPELNLAKNLARFDVVVLGDVAADRLGKSGPAALARAVREDGCGLLFTAGPERAATYRDTPLEPLLPAGLDYGKMEAEGRRVELAARAGRPEPLYLDPVAEVDHRLWSSVPESIAAWKPGKAREGASVWLRAGDRPALIAWRAGAGRAAVMAWPDHWRWARSGEDGAEGHRRFFARLAAWLAGRDQVGSGRLALSMTRYRLSPGEEVSLLARVVRGAEADAPITLSAEIASGREGAVPDTLKLSPDAPGPPGPPGPPGRYRAAVRAGEPGEYRLEVVARSLGAEWARAELFFSVEGRDVEMEDPAPDFAVLRRLAAETGGAFLGPAEAEGLAGRIAGSLPQPRRRVRVRRRLLWDRLGLLLPAVAALLAAWIILLKKED